MVSATPWSHACQMVYPVPASCRAPSVLLSAFGSALSNIMIADFLSHVMKPMIAPSNPKVS